MTGFVVQGQKYPDIIKSRYEVLFSEKLNKMKWNKNKSVNRERKVFLFELSWFFLISLADIGFGFNQTNFIYFTENKILSFVILLLQ